MSGPTATALIPFFVLLTVDVWVYMDARDRAKRGNEVTFRIGNLQLDTPVVWACGCVVLFFIFFPLYVVSRRAG